MEVSPGSPEVLSPIARTGYVPARVQGLPVEPWDPEADAQIDPRERQSWEGLAQHPPWSWEPYQGFGYLDRWVREADDALDDAEASKKRQISLGEVVDSFGDVRSQRLSLVEIIIIAAMGLWMMFPLEKVAAELDKLWRSERKRRPEFGNTIDALSFAGAGGGVFGCSSGPWVSKEDGPALRVAAPRKNSGGKRDMKPAKQTQSGSLGGAPGLDGAGVHADLVRMLSVAGISQGAANCVASYYAAGEKREGEDPRARALRRAIKRGDLADAYRCDNGLTKEAFTDEAFEGLMKRMKKAAEKALRVAPKNPISKVDGEPHDADECTVLRLDMARDKNVDGDGNEDPAMPRKGPPKALLPPDIIEVTEPIGLAS